MKGRVLSVACLFFVIAGFFILRAGEGCHPSDDPFYIEERIPPGEKVQITGRVYRKEQTSDYQILYLKNNSITYRERSLKESKFILYQDISENKKKEELRIGNVVWAEGEISYYERERNPGNFDQRSYYQRQGFHACLWAEDVQVRKADVHRISDALDQVRSVWKDFFLKIAGEKDGGILCAMLLGDKAQMDVEIKELYQVNGIAHILAISGLHLSFIGMSLYRILRKVSGSFLISGIVGILFMALYVLMIGASVSALRAVVMFLIHVGADMSGRVYDPPTSVASAAACVIAWRPLSYDDGGFQLSFGAIIGIFFLCPLIGSLTGKKNMLKDNLLASISVQLVTFPILLYHYYEFPLYSIFLNLVIVPLMSVLLSLGFLGSFFCLLSYLLKAAPAVPGILYFIGNSAIWLCKGILRLYEAGCELAVSLPGARIVTGRPELWQIVLYYGCLAAALFLWRRTRLKENERKGRKGAILACLIFGMGLLTLIHHFDEKGKLQVTVLDVGQGDSIFVKGPEGGTYLIDGGSSDVKNVGEYRIEPFLLSQGTGSLDYVFISHGDGDHINGISEMIQRREIGVRIRNLVLPAESVWNEEILELKREALQARIKVFTAQPGQELSEGSFTISCLWPADDAKLEPGNETSMVLALRYGAFDMLLAGDVEGEGETRLTEVLEEYGQRNWEALKVAHHGSKNSSQTEFLEAAQPLCAIISAGQGNVYGHPHAETLDRLNRAGCKIYSTQESGAVMIETDCRRMSVRRYLLDN